MDESSYFLAQQVVIDRTRDAHRHHERLDGAPWPSRRRRRLRLETLPDDPT